MEPAKHDKCVMIVAGEASGDHHGARLVESMKRLSGGGVYFCGIGGQSMEEAGVRILVDAGDICVVGLTEIAAKFGVIAHSLFYGKEVLREVRPDLLVLVDFPEFNLMLAREAKRLGIPVLYYISPQIWAWRRGRVRKIRRLVDHMAVILPFEREFYKDYDVPVTYVGHPLLDGCDTQEAGHESAAGEAGGPLVGLLPGSRHGELARHLPIQLEAAALVAKAVPEARFAVPVAPTLAPELVHGMLAKARARHPELSRVEAWPRGIGRVLAQSELVLCASGTVTLEAALAGTPMIVMYRMSQLSYLAARALIRVDHVGLVNLIAGYGLAPELLQHDANPERIAREITDMLNDPGRLEGMRRGLAEVRRRLGGPGASDRCARIALDLLSGGTGHVAEAEAGPDAA